jgi:hypothetical protein
LKGALLGPGRITGYPEVIRASAIESRFLSLAPAVNKAAKGDGSTAFLPALFGYYDQSLENVS